jgi:HlyD family secretion protein
MKQKKVLTYLLILLGILILVLIIGKSAGWFGGEFTYKVAAEHPAYRTIKQVVVANGKVQPEKEVKISPEVSGELIEIAIEEGDRVEKGDLLVRIKPDTYISLKERAEASLNSAKAQHSNSKARLAQTRAKYKKAEQDYKRNKKLWQEKTISDAEYESIISTYEMAKAELEAAKQSVASAKYTVESARASLNEAEENLKKTRIFSPMSGIVSRLNVEEGETVVGTKQMAGTELLRIADLEKMEVKVEVSENDIVQVNLGDTALVEIDAYLGREFEGVVTEIAHSANVEGAASDQVTNFDVKIRLLKDSYKELISPNNLYPFRPGLSATVDIFTDTKKGVLTVPIQAVTIRSKDQNKDAENLRDDAQEVVFSVEKDSVRLYKVKTGIQDNQNIEIQSGLDTTQQIVTAPYNAISGDLSEGDKVEVVDKKKLFEKNK